jgi:CheY-like chemotaxis protein
MSSFVRQPLFHPLSAVFVDDSADFLSGLRGVFRDRVLNRFFTDPRAALAYISSREREVPGLVLSGMDYSEIEKGAGNALGKDPLEDDSRFDEIAAVVVDYEMPEMDGIRFLSSIHDAACTKILLTGIAGDREAVDAFNAGLIDFYLRKTDADMPAKLANILADANKKHCRLRGQIGVHDVGATYCDSRVMRLLDEIAAREGCVEYYWRPAQNAVLMFDASGCASVFIAWDEDEWVFQCDTVVDAGGPDWLREGMEERRIMPLFWPYEAYRADQPEIRTTRLQPIPEWSGAFYSVTRLEPSEIDPSPLTFAAWHRAKQELARIATLSQGDISGR